MAICNFCLSTFVIVKENIIFVELSIICVFFKKCESRMLIMVVNSMKYIYSDCAIKVI